MISKDMISKDMISKDKDFQSLPSMHDAKLYLVDAILIHSHAFAILELCTVWSGCLCVPHELMLEPEHHYEW